MLEDFVVSFRLHREGLIHTLTPLQLACVHVR